MALNSSGQISISSNVAGESIALELGRSLVAPTSLNETTVRTLAEKPSGAVSMPVDFWGKGAFTNGTPTMAIFGNANSLIYVQILGIDMKSSVGTSYLVFNNGIVTDPVCSQVTDVGFNWASIAANGTVSTVNQFSTANAHIIDEYNNSDAIDNSSNFYAMIKTGNPVSVSYDRTLIKISNAGDISFAKTLSFLLYDSRYVISKGTGSLYGTAGSYSDSTKGMLYKIDSSGNPVWAYTYPRVPGVPGNNGYLGEITLDISDNIYITTENNRTGPEANTTRNLFKLDSNATFQQSITWTRNNTSNTAAGAYNSYVDSFGNIYVVNNYYRTTTTAVNITIVAKFDSSMTLQWQRQIASSASQTDTSITTDKDGNVYVAQHLAATAPATAIWKWNSSGTMQWQRRLTSNTTLVSNTLRITTTLNTLQIAFEIQATNYDMGCCSTGLVNRPFFAMLPLDGSKTGTYSIPTGVVKTGAAANVTMTYSATTLTESAASLTYTAGGSFTLTANSFTTSDLTVNTVTPSVVSKTGQIFL